jgi:RNA polymerase sigma-70 factor (ECF subfamily)
MLVRAEPEAQCRRIRYVFIVSESEPAFPRLCQAGMHWYGPPVLRNGEPPSEPPATGGGSDDERLIGAIAQGDRDALGLLYDRYAPTMLAVAQRVLGAAQPAEDLVQDVFLEAWHRARHYDASRGTVRTWLMLRLRSRAIDRKRAAQRARRVDLDEAKLGEQSARDGEPISAREASTLRGLLAELSSEQKAVLELGYFGGLSCAEIASRLDVPIGTVKSRMSRAIAHLRVRLQVADGAPP